MENELKEIKDYNNECEIENVKVQLEELKRIFELPRLFMSNFFMNLRHSIYDAAFKCNLKNKDTNKFKKNVLKMIQRFYIFETECFELFPDNRFDVEVTKDINNVISEFHIDYLKSNEIEDYLNTINDSLFRIKQILFNNKTIHFIDNSFTVKKLKKRKSIGKLLIVNNQYFEKEALDILFGKYLIFFIFFCWMYNFYIS